MDRRDLCPEDLDLLSSIVLFGFGLFALASGIYMCFFAVTGAKVWYYSPGFFPAFIGAVLMLLAVLLFRKKYVAGGRLPGIGMIIKRLEMYRPRLLRLALAVSLFAAYVFLLIGKIPFAVATFLYLAATMILFRTKDFAIWKLILISAATTGAVCLFFGVIAAVPLP